MSASVTWKGSTGFQPDSTVDSTQARPATPTANATPSAGEGEADSPVEASMIVSHNEDSFEAAAYSRSGSTSVGGAEVSGSVSAGQIKVSDELNVKADTTGVHVEVELDVQGNLADVQGKAEKTFEIEVGGEKYKVTVDLSAEGVIGADGKIHLELNLGPDGVSSSESAVGFAGAKGTIEVEVKVDHETKKGDVELADLSVQSGAIAGVAGGWKRDSSYKGGKFSFEDSFEEADGAGLSFEVKGEVDVNEAGKLAQAALVDAVDQGADWAKGELEQVGDAIADAGGSILGATKDALGDAWSKAKGLFSWI